LELYFADYAAASAAAAEAGALVGATLEHATGGVVIALAEVLVSKIPKPTRDRDVVLLSVRRRVTSSRRSFRNLTRRQRTEHETGEHSEHSI